MVSDSDENIVNFFLFHDKYFEKNLSKKEVDSITLLLYLHANIFSN